MRLSDITRAIVDCEHKTAPEGDGYAYSVGTKAMKGGRLVLTAAKPVSEQTYIGWTRRMRPVPGDLILAREAPVGDVIRVPDEPLVCLGQRTVLIRPDSEKVHPRFLHYWLLGPDAQGVMRAQTGGATVGHLNVDDIRKLDVAPMPTDPRHQASAADLLGAIDDLIENNRRRVDVLEKVARAIYREWFVKFRYPGHGAIPLVDSSVGPIPEGWTAGTVGSALELRYGKALKADARRGGDFAVVSSAGIVGWHNESIVSGPAIVVGRKGNVGSVHWVDGPCWPIDTAYFVDTDLPLRFVAEQLRRTEFTNSHAAVPGLSREGAYTRPFLIPPSEHLDSFQAVVDPLGSAASAISLQSDKLASLRDLLLPKMVTGQIDVSELDLDALIQDRVE